MAKGCQPAFLTVRHQYRKARHQLQLPVAFTLDLAVAVSPISNLKFQISGSVAVRIALAVVGAAVHHRPALALGFRF